MCVIRVISLFKHPCGSGMSLASVLKNHGLWPDDVAQYCMHEGLETTDDLAYLFNGPEEVEANAPCMVESWLLVAKGKGATFASARRESSSASLF